MLPTEEIHLPPQPWELNMKLNFKQLELFSGIPKNMWEEKSFEVLGIKDSGDSCGKDLSVNKDNTKGS
jgi:hypothetical protein